MQSLNIQGFSYAERNGLLFSLTTSLDECGGWLLERKSLSPATLELRIEIQLLSIVDLYAALIAAGVELTRDGHLALTSACNCRRNLSIAADLGQVISICLEVSFLEDMTLQSLLMTGGPLA